MEDLNLERQLAQLRAELKVLIQKGLIKPVADLHSLSPETLQELVLEGRAQKLGSVNATICVGLINGFSLFCKHSSLVPEEQIDKMREELLSNEALLSQGTDIISKVTPHIPMIGLVVGAGILSKYIFDGICSARRVTAEAEEFETEMASGLQ